jgi:hypothetical protein
MTAAISNNGAWITLILTSIVCTIFVIIALVERNKHD